jgi:transposase
VSYVKIACKCRDQIRSFFASLPQPSAVAIETVGFYRWLWRELEPLAWAPPENVQVLRNWTRHRNGLTRQHAKVLHHVKSTLNRLNFPGPARLDAAALQRYLLAGVERFSADDVTMLWQHQRRLIEIEQDRAQSERRINELMRAPEFARYAGLAPTVYASGNSSRLGHISKTGAPDLRWVLQQAAWTAIRCDAGLKKTWLRIAKTAGKKAAAVAIARKILVLMWTLVRKDEPYKSREPVAA